jgi:ribosome-interacting GTPase 1
MLTKEDIEFIAEALNKTSFNGISTAHQLVKIVMKLSEMKKGLENEQARVTGHNGPDGPAQEEVVP